MNKPAFFFGLIFIISFIVFLSHFIIVGSSVWGDGQYYYSYLRSVIIDKDLNFQNELTHFQRPLEMTVRGLPGNKYSIGPALFWLPFFLIAHFIAFILYPVGVIIKTDGYSFLYQIITGLGSVFYGVLGLYLCFLAVRKYYPAKIAYLATFTIWLASNLFFYTVLDPVNSHPISFFLSSLTVYLSVKIKTQKSIKSILLLGIASGLLVTVRNQDVIFLLPLFFLLKNWRQRLSWLFITCLSFLPQLLIWHYLYGVWQNPYLATGEKFFWLNPKILPVLFGTANGLFYYSPILLAALAGFYYLYRKNHFLAVSAIMIFISETYIIACWHAFEGGQAYGGRFFISLMPYFIFGLAALVNRFVKRYKILMTASLVYTMINFISIIRFLLTY